jgi:hypothetical protein
MVLDHNLLHWRVAVQVISIFILQIIVSKLLADADANFSIAAEVVVELVIIEVAVAQIYGFSLVTLLA